MMFDILSATAWESFKAYFTTGDCLNEFVFVLEILFAGILGMIIGVERMFRQKEAGLRTHILVAIGSTLIMVISRYGFGDGDYDVARVAAQVVSGIGFLGAGIIIYRKETLHGVTTAAGIWYTAGIGMCVGGGLYLLAIFATLLYLIAQACLPKKFKYLDSKHYNVLRIKFIYSDENTKMIKDVFGDKDFEEFNLLSEDDKTIAIAELKISMKFTIEEIAKFKLENSDILEINRVNRD